MTAGYRLKRRGGFFAAGTEFARALDVLGDGAFKLFAHVCLEADRASGRLAFDRGELAGRLGKSRSALGRHLRELVRADVCELETAPNQHRNSVLAVRAEYWPYRATQGVAPARPDPDANAYVEAVRRAFLGPVCVQAAFGPADERLAVGWHARGVPLETVRHAILLGCVRKSMALIDRPAAQPVCRLALFRTAAAGSPARELPRQLLATSGVQPRSLRGLLAASSRGRAGPCLAKNGTGRPGCRPCPCLPSRERTSKERRDDDVYTFPVRRDPIDGGANELSS